jgi:hypothetical protein
VGGGRCGDGLNRNVVVDGCPVAAAATTQQVPN